jgi:hypothetical protein
MASVVRRTQVGKRVSPCFLALPFQCTTGE